MPAVNFLGGVLGNTGSNGANFEPQRVNNAVIRIDGLGGAGIDDNFLVLSVSSFPLPKVNNNPIEVGYLNEKRKFAGNPTFDDLSVVFNDYIDVGTAALLMRWRYSVYNPETGTIGLASQYKKRGDVTLFAPNGVDRYDRVYELVGVWPSQYDPGEIDHEGEGVVKITLTLTIDKAVPSTNLSPNSIR